MMSDMTDPSMDLLVEGGGNDETTMETSLHDQSQRGSVRQRDNLANGSVLEAAFVDPAYSWPPVDGMGKNAIELQASSALMNGEDDDDSSVKTTESEKERMKIPPKPKASTGKKNSGAGAGGAGFSCCSKSKEAVVGPEMMEYEKQKKTALKARQEYKAKKKLKERAKRKQTRHRSVPEGILIYKLDTTKNTIELMSDPGSNTDLESLMRTMVIASAGPSNDTSRRGIELIGVDGSTAKLVACEQRTAIAWLEAMDMMLANKPRTDASKNVAKENGAKVSHNPKSRNWGKENLNENERDHIEEEYLGLAAYSNKLIRAGALPGKSKSKHAGGAGGIYYNVEFHSVQGDQYEREALESLAKRRAVIKDSWDFYRMICSLLRDRRKYDEVFRQLQMDPVYPYLNSMTGLNDPGDKDGYGEKTVIQKDLPDYSRMTKTQVAEALVKKAEQALPSLVEICKALAGSLGMEEVGVGPVKEIASVIRKAEKKYEGDLLKVTDYCRALLVVKDFPSLLALLELARDSFGPLIRRVKLTTLKMEHKPLQGGYRDCKINLELKEHICEIQVHLLPMWSVCGVDGFRHYRHCLEYATDSFDDPYDALDGLDRKTVAELIVMAEEAVVDKPLDDLEWQQEKYILDYFAEVGLFMKHGLNVWADVTLRQLIKLRCESPDIGPDHHETYILYKYFERVLRKTGNPSEADTVMQKIEANSARLKKEEKEAEQSLWDSFMNAPNEAYDSLFDPNRKEREEEENLRREVKASKKLWRKIRQERFSFLDSARSQAKQQ